MNRPITFLDQEKKRSLCKLSFLHFKNIYVKNKAWHKRYYFCDAAVRTFLYCNKTN